MNINNPSGGLDEGEILFPEIPILEQNYPNPFNPETTIKFEIQKAGQVNLSIFNLLGERVTILEDGYLSEGVYQKKLINQFSTSGVYFCRLESDKYSITKKILFVQ